MIQAPSHVAPEALAASGARLQVVGTGIRVICQTTPEATAAIEAASLVLHAVADPLTVAWITRLNSASRPLPFYREGESRLPIYEEWVERILSALADGERVCVVFYGHPGIFVRAGHTVVRRARQEGYPAEMVPGISASDCLFADLGIDPARDGCQSFDATAFVRRRPRFDPETALILWQVSVIGEERFVGDFAAVDGLRELVELLAASYGPHHEVVLYEAARYGFALPRIDRLPLRCLCEARVSGSSTLFVPAASVSPAADRGPPPPPISP